MRRYPVLPGLGFSVIRRPVFGSLIRTSPSLREVGSLKVSSPLKEFELTYEVLRASASLPELQQLEELFLLSRGSYDYFLFTDPIDNAVTASQIGTGDGTNTTFVLGRNVGPSYYEAISYLDQLTSLTLAGSAVDPSAYTFVAPNILQFNTAPAAGQVLLAGFTHAYLCRFSEDEITYEQFCSNLYSVGSVKLKQVVY